MSFEKPSAAIRLIGQHHTSHHHGEVLQIADESVVRNNPTFVVTLARAHELVARGDAEWVGQAPRPELMTLAAPPGDRPEEGDDDIAADLADDRAGDDDDDDDDGDGGDDDGGYVWD